MAKEFASGMDLIDFLHEQVAENTKKMIGPLVKDFFPVLDDYIAHDCRAREELNAYLDLHPRLMEWENVKRLRLLLEAISWGQRLAAPPFKAVALITTVAGDRLEWGCWNESRVLLLLVVPGLTLLEGPETVGSDILERINRFIEEYGDIILKDEGVLWLRKIVRNVDWLSSPVDNFELLAVLVRLEEDICF